MSVIFVTDRHESIRETVEHLCRQSVRDRLELVIAVPSAAALYGADFEGLAGVRVVELGPMIDDFGAARAAAVREASAPIVVFAETHCYPQPGWAEALIAAHEGPWAAVGPALLNANPDDMVSRASFAIGYGPWAAPVEGGPVENLPGHNSSYKRDVLLGYGERLPALLRAETILHWDLRSRGEGLLLEPAATVRHLNVTRRRSWLVERFHAGRLFGAARVREWSLPKRLLYIAGAPLIPLVRLPRVLRDVRRTEPARVLPRLLPVVVLSLVLQSVGEMTGCALGSGGAVSVLRDIEMHRSRHVRSRRASGVRT